MAPRTVLGQSYTGWCVARLDTAVPVASSGGRSRTAARLLGVQPLSIRCCSATHLTYGRPARVGPVSLESGARDGEGHMFDCRSTRRWVNDWATPSRCDRQWSRKTTQPLRVGPQSTFLMNCRQRSASRAAQTGTWRTNDSGARSVWMPGFPI
jgi:hypothetical protein